MSQLIDDMWHHSRATTWPPDRVTSRSYINTDCKDSTNSRMPCGPITGCHVAPLKCLMRALG
jgi:hypothetical protein